MYGDRIPDTHVEQGNELVIHVVFWWCGHFADYNFLQTEVEPKARRVSCVVGRSVRRAARLDGGDTQRWKGDLLLGVDIHETPRTTGVVDEDNPVGLHACLVVAAHEGQVDG